MNHRFASARTGSASRALGLAIIAVVVMCLPLASTGCGKKEGKGGGDGGGPNPAAKSLEEQLQGAEITEEGKPTLLNPVHSHDQRAQLFLIEVLDLIDEDRHGGLPVLRCFADGDK